MILRCVIPILTTCLLLIGCSDSKPLDAVTTVIDHSDCEKETVVIKLEAIGGEAPYIYQIRQQIDNKIVLTEVSDEKEIIVELPNLPNIFYELEIIDNLLANEISEFTVRPEGHSIISDVLHIEEKGILYPMYKVPVQIYSINEETELFRTIETDDNGRFTFDNIPSGIYSIAMTIPEKYNSYHLEALNKDNHVRMQNGENATMPFSLNCRMNLNIDFVFKK